MALPYSSAQKLLCSNCDKHKKFRQSTHLFVLVVKVGGSFTGIARVRAMVTAYLLSLVHGNIIISCHVAGVSC